jgi:hypothetical protein
MQHTTSEGFQKAPGAEVKSKSLEEDHQVQVRTRPESKSSQFSACIHTYTYRGVLTIEVTYTCGVGGVWEWFGITVLPIPGQCS